MNHSNHVISSAITAESIADSSVVAPEAGTTPVIAFDTLAPPAPSVPDLLTADDLEVLGVSLVLVVSGYDAVAAQTVHARKTYDHSDIRFGQRYADILGTSEDGRLRIDYSRFHETLEG